MLADVYGISLQTKQGVQVRSLLPEYGSEHNGGGDSGILGDNRINMGQTGKAKTEDKMCSGIHELA
ncbi:hypothetical protein D3C75_726210 [compost metagenome]